MFMREAIFKLRQMRLYTKIMAFSANGDFHAAAVWQFSTVWASSQWKQIYLY